MATPPTGLNGGGQTLLSKVNPFTILVGMGMASLFTWFLAGGRQDHRTRATTRAGYMLGDEIDGRLITAVRTRWEYQVDNTPQWQEEETLW